MGSGAERGARMAFGKTAEFVRFHLSRRRLIVVEGKPVARQRSSPESPVRLRRLFSPLSREQHGVHPVSSEGRWRRTNTSPLGCRFDEVKRRYFLGQPSTYESSPRSCLGQRRDTDAHPGCSDRKVPPSVPDRSMIRAGRRWRRTRGISSRRCPTGPGPVVACAGVRRICTPVAGSRHTRSCIRACATNSRLILYTAPPICRRIQRTPTAGIDPGSVPFDGARRCPPTR